MKFMSDVNGTREMTPSHLHDHAECDCQVKTSPLVYDRH